MCRFSSGVLLIQVCTTSFVHILLLAPAHTWPVIPSVFLGSHLAGHPSAFLGSHVAGHRLLASFMPCRFLCLFLPFFSPFSASSTTVSSAASGDLELGHVLVSESLPLLLFLEEPDWHDLILGLNVIRDNVFCMLNSSACQSSLCVEDVFGKASQKPVRK